MLSIFQRFISRRKPIVFENSQIPTVVGWFAPIEPYAVSFGPFVFCKEKLNERLLRHETIHYHQQIELLFVLQWILYLLFYLKGLVKEDDPKSAYRQNPFELEAYDNDDNEDYLSDRPLFNWSKYL